MSPEKTSLQQNSPEKMSPDAEKRQKAIEFLKNKSEFISEINQMIAICKEHELDKLPLEELNEMKEDVEAALKEEKANETNEDVDPEEAIERQNGEEVEKDEENAGMPESKVEESPDKVEKEDETPKEEKVEESSSENEKSENVEEVEEKESALGVNEAEKMQKYEHFTRREIAELIESGLSNQEIWEKVKEEGVFFKFDGSSYYLSGHKDVKENKKREKDSEEEQEKYTWRGRSATKHTHSNYKERDMFGYIEKALEDYRELQKVYPSLKDAIMAADMVQENEQKYTTNQIMNKVMPMSKYWGKIAKTIDGYKAPESIDNESQDDGLQKEKGLKTSTVEEGEATNAESQNNSDADDTDAEESKSADVSAEMSKQEKQPETPGSAEGLSEGDMVYYMEQEMRRWRDPKEIKAIKDVDSEKYAKFVDDDSLYPLGKLARAEDLDTDDAAYTPGPKNAGEYLTAEDVENAPEADELAEEIPEELRNVPGAEVIAQDVEKMPKEERENVDKFWQNLGYKAEQAKAWVQKKTFSKLSDTLNKNDDQSSMARWVTALKDQATEKEQQAQEARVKREETKKDGIGWEKTKAFLGDKWQITSNALKAGSMFISPHRWFMLGGLAVSSGGEAGKEARFNNIDFIKETRYENAEAAAAEAWAVYEQAEKQAGGDSEVTKEILQNAYTQSLPENILRRLGEYEDFKKDTFYDADKAHEEALRMQKEAQQMSGSEKVSTEDLQKAFEKLFENPEPGQNTSFISSLFEKQITRLAKRTQNKFFDIDMDDSLTDEEKKKKKEEYLSKWGRSKALQDYDRMITEQGKIDSWAMSAHEANRIGKGVVAATMAHTFYKTLGLLPDLFTSTHDISDEISSPDTSIGSGDGIDSGQQDSLSTGGSEGLTTAEADSVVADSSGIQGAPDDIEQIDRTKIDSTTADTTQVEPETADTLEAFSPDSSAADTDTGQADQSEIVEADTTNIGDEQSAPASTDSATADSAAAEGSSEGAEVGESDVEMQPITPEANIEALGVQEVVINDDGEGMIHAIADTLEEKFEIPRDQAMRIGNELYLKGEQLEGTDAEMYNLVGKGSSFSLDFGELTAEELQEGSPQDLVENIEFSQNTFEEGPSGIKGLELPDQETADQASTATSAEDVSRQTYSIETRDLDTSSYDLSSVGDLETRTAGMDLDRFREVLDTNDVTADIHDRLDEGINSSRMSTSSTYEGIRVSALSDLRDYLYAHSEQNIVDTVEEMREENPRLLMTLDRVIELEDPDYGGPMHQLEKYISTGYLDMYATSENVSIPRPGPEAASDTPSDLADDASADTTDPRPENPIQTKEIDGITIEQANEQAAAADKAAWQERVNADKNINVTTVDEAQNPSVADTDFDQVRAGIGEEGIRVDKPEAVSNPSEAAANVGVDVASVNAVDMSKLQAMAVDMEMQTEMGNIAVPAEKFDELEAYINENLTRDTSDVIKELAESNPELLTALERALDLDDNGGILDKESLKPIRRYTWQFASQLTEEDFPNGIPDYALTSIEESKRNLR